MLVPLDEDPVRGLNSPKVAMCKPDNTRAGLCALDCTVPGWVAGNIGATCNGNEKRGKIVVLRDYAPVEAPLGTAARKRPLSVTTSTSMVGLPRESKI